jgi:hypothetical protein
MGPRNTMDPVMKATKYSVGSEFDSRQNQNFYLLHDAQNGSGIHSFPFILDTGIYSQGVRDTLVHIRGPHTDNRKNCPSLWDKLAHRRDHIQTHTTGRTARHCGIH